MRAQLGVAALLVILAGCGGETAPTATPAPTPTATPTPTAEPAGDHEAEPPFGPDGFGQIVLGLDGSALTEVPGLEWTGGGRCATFSAPGVGGGFEEGPGVIYLAPRGDLETPEGIRVGSTVAEIRAAYPAATGDETFWSVPLGRHGRYYRFDIDRDRRVVSMVLVSGEQHCVS